MWTESTLPESIQRWAVERPSKISIRFLGADGSVTDELTYGELQRRALAVAAALRSRWPEGSRALILCETGPHFLDAFLGCLAAGAVAVPADLPHGRRAWGGIAGIAADCQPAVILTTTALRERWRTILGELSQKHRCELLAVDEAVAGAGATGIPGIAGSQLAFLQYTSGSTGQPKGVMVSHANLRANAGVASQAFSLSGETQVVSWLPLFHDMGLIGFTLQPLFLGATATLMSPLTFLKKPAQWLRAVTRYGATFSGGPNFAYDLCCEKIGPEQRRELDLSTWRTAVNGAEPVSGRTLSRFEETFAECGFQPHSIRPGYGMAEATLVITASGPGETVRRVPASRVSAPSGEAGEHLAETGFWVESEDVVSCGRTVSDTEVRIVDPDSRRACRDGRVGEVWARGGQIAQGYWQKPEVTAATFDARLEDEPNGAGYLRTGDLGFVEAGQLFLIGRIKELIIIRGRNYAPRDIEEAVVRSHEAVRMSHVAAVGFQRGVEAELGLVAEIDRRFWRTYDAEAVVKAVREAVFEEMALRVAAVVLLRPGSMPKTTSGKLKRVECRRHLQGEIEDAGFKILHEWRLPTADAAGEPPAPESESGAAPQAVAPQTVAPQTVSPRTADLQGLEHDARVDLVLDWLRERLAHAVGCSAEEVADEEPFAQLGFDSALAVALTGQLSEWLELELEPTMFWEHVHPLELAEHLASETAAQS
ncbi:MAG: AMP-binding protein [Acidobacteriota bacterium]